MNMVRFGYRLPFSALPPPFYAKNNLSSLSHTAFVEESISDLLAKKCILQVYGPPHSVSPLTVSAKRTKLRLVLDLRHVNNYLFETKFKYENLKRVAEIFETDYYFITFDLKSGYHHVPIHPDHWTYLGFSWTFPTGQTNYYTFIVLPFGLSSACYAFTKLLRPLVEKWRSQGIRTVIYLDDGICGSPSYERTKEISITVRADLDRHGLTINLLKSVLTPTKTGKWLGFIINTSKMTFSVPPEKISILLSMINLALTSPFSSAKDISRIAGRIISMSPALGPISRLMTRNTYLFIESRLT